MQTRNALYENSACAMCRIKDSSLGLCQALVSKENSGTFAALPHSQRGKRANELIYSQGKSSDDVVILCYGVAATFKRLADGRRKIHSFLLSGDPISISSIFNSSLPFSVEALTEVRFCLFSRAVVQRSIASNPKLLPAIAEVCTEEDSYLREHSVDLALLNARERVWNLLSIFVRRMSQRHVSRDGSYPFPLRQRDIAECLGLSLSHVNRVICELRNEEIIELSSTSLKVLTPGLLDPN